MSAIVFGRHRGKPLPEVPTSYLEWVCRTNAQAGTFFVGIDNITAELQRRQSGSNRSITRLEITDHALERARLRLAPIYLERRKTGEKIKDWMGRVFKHVLAKGQMRKSYQSRHGQRFKQPRYEYFLQDSINGMEWKFVTQGNDAYQTLITVFAPGYTDDGRLKA